MRTLVCLLETMVNLYKRMIIRYTFKIEIDHKVMVSDRGKAFIMEKIKKSSVGSIVLALICMLFLISGAVVVTLNFRQLYYFDIQHLDIPATSGLPESVIRENYDVLIDYNSIFYQGELNFPSLAMSETGQIHFVEVKRIFVAVVWLAVITGIIALAGGIYKSRQKDFKFLKWTGIFSIVIPAVLGGLIALNWNTFFVTFHHIFFNNDYWIFDPATDPVITILPDMFFMHCALMILGLVVVCSILAILAYNGLKKKSH